MDRRLAAKILVAASIVFGGTIAIMAVVGSPALGTFAMVGAIALGLLWVLTGLFGKRPDAGERSS